MWTCFMCLHQSVYWQSDFDAEDCGYDGVGAVSFFTCGHCGAEYEVARIEYPEEKVKVEGKKE